MLVARQRLAGGKTTLAGNAATAPGWNSVEAYVSLRRALSLNTHNPYKLDTSYQVKESKYHRGYRVGYNKEPTRAGWGGDTCDDDASERWAQALLR